MRTRNIIARMAQLLLVSLFGSVLASPSPSSMPGSDLVVIVSAKSPVTTLRPDQVAAIFLGQTARFPDGGEAVPLDQRIGSPLRDEFYARVANRTPVLVKAYWSKMVFTGRGQPPAEATDSVAVRRQVAESPDTIGYIDRSALDNSVRPVLVVQ